MKRQPALRRLSSEHHRALVLAKRLRGVEEDADVTLRQSLMQQLLASWRDEVAPHFALEEEFLLPLLARFSGLDAPLVAETLRQHLQLRAWLDQVRQAQAAGTVVDGALLRMLGDALQQHVRFEENELFAAVEEQLPTEQLERLRQLLEH